MSNNIYPRTIGEEKIVYKGKHFAVGIQQRELAENVVKEFEQVYRTPGVRIIVLSADKTKVILTYEANRYDQKQDDIRIPGGKVYKNVDDYLTAKANGAVNADAKLAAIKELVEEAGLKAEEIEFKEFDLCNGGVDMTLFWYVVIKYSELSSQKLDPGEYITTKWVSIDEAIDYCMSNDTGNKINEDRTRGVLLPLLIGIQKKALTFNSYFFKKRLTGKEKRQVFWKIRKQFRD